jgi:methionine-rich copper-binding protein CopC
MFRLSLAAGVAVFAAIPAVAFAHAQLSSAVPAENAAVPAPTQVLLGFTQALEKGFSTIEVVDAKGKRVDDGKPLGDTDATHLAIGLPKLPAGKYKVIWHATSVDTHRTEGSFTFTITP